MKLTISLVFVLLLTLTSAAIAGEAELSEIARPVDEEAATLAQTFSLMPAADVQADADEVSRHEDI